MKKTKSRKEEREAKALKKDMAVLKADLLNSVGEEVEGEIVEKGPTDRFGRPTVITEYVKDRLLQAFTYGCTDKEAALFAGIGERTLYDYSKKDPDFREHCIQLKDTPTLTARITLVEKLSKSAYYALEYLQRKRSDEFGMKLRHTIEPPEELTEEERDRLDNMLNANLRHRSN